MGPLNRFVHCFFVHLHNSPFIFCRQDEKPPVTRTGSKQELPPLSRTGSPTAAEKDILVCVIYSNAESVVTDYIVYLLVMSIKDQRPILQVRVPKGICPTLQRCVHCAFQLDCWYYTCSISQYIDGSWALDCVRNSNLCSICRDTIFIFTMALTLSMSLLWKIHGWRMCSDSSPQISRLENSSLPSLTQGLNTIQLETCVDFHILHSHWWKRIEWPERQHVSSIAFACGWLAFFWVASILVGGY